jgi:ankyrin repeat protein
MILVVSLQLCFSCEIPRWLVDVFQSGNLNSINENESAIKQFINCKDCVGQTPLTIAALNRQSNIVDFLLKFETTLVHERHTNLNTALHYTVSNLDINTVNILVSHLSIDSDVDIQYGDNVEPVDN